MSLNDKARAALKRELSRAFPERAANDPGHDRLADALTRPTRWEVKAKRHGTRHEAVIRDDHGGLIASVASASDAPVLAAAPDLLEACKEMLARLGSLSAESRNMMLSEDADNLNMGAVYLRNAIAKAEGGAK